MKVSLNCKLDSAGAYGFIKPIADIADIEKIDVFRDMNALPCDKVTYHSAINRKNGIVSQISKFFKMLFIVNEEHKLAIGIYEIPHGLLAFLVGKIKRVPVVISVIGNPVDVQLRNYIRRKSIFYMYRKVDAITVTGTKSKKFLTTCGINSKKVFILPNAIDVDKFIQNKSMPKEFDVISLGRLSPEKALINFVEIIKLIKMDIPNVKVAIAGKGPEEKVIRKKITEYGLEENIAIIGYVDSIVEFYNKARIFILTSRSEGLPRTVLEAMSCGIPCIASNVGDMEDIIEHEVNGFLVNDYQNINDYYNFTKRLLNDKNLYERISKLAIKRVNMNYSYNSATKVWEKILELGY
ncbi:MAG: glycosyltransferase family 4 protein [Melioribacteraceae bacterium]|nr:glycosyltransferase family 4 protein [Bacteroidales bacterium]MCF8298703.1 glycosyltransferase family 4 protein [Saprospiraceae bacterium]MCF8395955.1 glycosyltransferase family 4 protein [Melioribacteraceae bacterium]